MKGQVISGKFNEILIREKQQANLELGELLVSDAKEGKIILQVYDLLYGSQISQQNLELISGMNMEEQTDFEFVDPSFRNYNLALAKNLIAIQNNKGKSSKILPAFFSSVRAIEKQDMDFLAKPKIPLFFGYLRSGSKKVDVPISLDAKDVLSHHMLICGTTGKGKSVFMKNILWDCMNTVNTALLVLDPHDEYYGKNNFGLKDHPQKQNLVFYGVKHVPSGERTLKINIALLKPEHLDFMDFTQAQYQILHTYYRKYGKDWILNLFTKDVEDNQEFQEVSLAVVRRKLKLVLDIDADQNTIFCNGIFDHQAGQTTIADIVRFLEEGKLVIIDTSSFSGNTELLIGSMIATDILNHYRHYKSQGAVKPVVSIVLEEAPRVLGKQILENRKNVFETIAREGRKFNVGLTAITQLPSLIPKEILANMNTKVILGIEMKTERDAIIESASQDLSSDSRTIASLDKGEAIITSNFARFAIPIVIPLFDDKKNTVKKNALHFDGVALE
ncbi:ATP-binding protein [Candidatus Woesearchaeota archaeon]|nr:MAG: ATP-binding protein [Candidatus Woesearchaeota archaeon]